MSEGGSGREKVQEQWPQLVVSGSLQAGLGSCVELETLCGGLLVRFWQPSGANEKTSKPV